MPKKIDLTNQRFGKLIAIKEAPKELRSGGRVTWVCKCDCGSEVAVPSNRLRYGKTKSCGCLREMTYEERIALGYWPSLEWVKPSATVK